MTSLLRHFLRDTSGTTAMEYCLIGAIVSLAIIAGVTTIGTKLNKIFLQIAAVN